MPTVTLRYKLPNEQAEYDAARLGADARATLMDIDQRLRNLLKHCDPTPEVREVAEQLRDMIAPELLD